MDLNNHTNKLGFLHITGPQMQVFIKLKKYIMIKFENFYNSFSTVGNVERKHIHPSLSKPIQFTFLSIICCYWSSH